MCQLNNGCVSCCGDFTAPCRKDAVAQARKILCSACVARVLRVFADSAVTTSEMGWDGIGRKLGGRTQRMAFGHQRGPLAINLPSGMSATLGYEARIKVSI